jgi:hypothetical protein
VTQLDALRLVEITKERIVRLAISENYLSDARMADAAGKIWSSTPDEGGLVSELWVQGAYPSELSEDTLASLTGEQLFPHRLATHLNASAQFPSDRRLFSHQSLAVRLTAKADPKSRNHCLNGSGKDRSVSLADALRTLDARPSTRRNRYALSRALSDERPRN